MQKQLTVFIGRFSPFHLGHEEVLKRALMSSEVVLLLIGSSFQARNIKNPFTGEERKKIIEDWYRPYSAQKSYGRLVIKCIADHPYNDQKWISDVQVAVYNTRKYADIPDSWPNVLTGAERDASTWYLKAFGSFFKQDFVKETAIGFDTSATQIRDDYFNCGNAWEYKTPAATIAFLDSFEKTEEYTRLQEEYRFVREYKEAWSKAPYAPTFVTVDACVIQSGHVLVVTRAAQPGKGLIALPGGFVEQKEKLQDACIRELQEETSIGLSPAQLYGSIVDKEIFDHPDRSLRGRTITTCYLLKLKDTVDLPKIKPQKGEAVKVQWIPIAEALGRPEMWFEDHYSMFTTMLARVKS